MIHPLPSKRSAILTGMIAAATLFISVDAAQAGPAEIKALTAELASIRPASGTTEAANLSNATADELATAVANVITNNPKLKPGVVAGEALKSSAGTSQDAAVDIAEALSSKIGTVDRSAVEVAVGDAARTAGSGKGLDVSEIPAFAAALLEGRDEGRDAALIAVKSKSGAGAILGGIASEAQAEGDKTADEVRIDLVNGAFQDKKLAGAALDISRFVAAETDDSDEFAVAVAQANNKLALNIATGASAGDPTNAGEIVRQLTVAGDPLLKTIVLKGASKLAKSVGAVADIEQIVLVGKALADQIGAGAADSKGKPLIKPTQAAGLAKTLAQAILAKPITTDGANSLVNKADEIAEVAAFIAGGIIGNSTVSLKTAPKLFLAIIKGAVAGGKASKKQTGLDATYISDIAGSVALTVKNSNLSENIKDAIEALLLDPQGKTAKSIGGTNAPAVKTALELGFRENTDNDPTTNNNDDEEANSRLEDGNLDFLAVAEPETNSQDFDIRPFTPDND